MLTLGLLVLAPVTAVIRAPSLRARAPVPGAPAGVTAVVKVNVIPMDTERVLQNQTVLVQNGWITMLGPATQVKVPPGATRIEGQGKYLMPGLADMHVHLVTGSSGARDSMGMDRLLLQYVASGVTTVRNMDHTPVDSTGAQKVDLSPQYNEMVLRWKARAAAGHVLSPQIYTSGPWYGYGGSSRDPNTVPLGEIAHRIAAYKAAGYDFVKPYWESRAIFDSVAVAAQRIGLPLAGHIPEEIPLVPALKAMRSIEHQIGILFSDIFLPDPPAFTLARLASVTKHTGAWICPTLNVITKDVRRHALAKVMHDSGVGLLLGTDGGARPPISELNALTQRAGLTAYQALVTGTRNPAQFFDVLEKSGTVAMNKRADLVLLSGNPLENIANVVRPAGVMLGGRWLPREELDRLLAAD